MVNIRAYTTQDRQDCLAIFESNCPKYFDADEILGLENWLNGQDSGQITYQTSASDYFYVLEENLKIIACGGFYIVKDKPNANMVWGMVNQSHHKNGYGSLLFQHRINQIKMLHPNFNIMLDTSQHTYAFFEKFGFKTHKISKDAYGPGLDRYDMIL
jgi:N-acetylglutamate synthase-like GNAT family acetyltransferase